MSYRFLTAVFYISLLFSITPAAHAQNSPAAPEVGTIDERLKELDLKIRALESSLVTKDDVAAGLKELGDETSRLEALQNQVNEAQKKVVEDNLNLSTHYFDILGTLLGVAALMAGLAGFVIYQWVSKTAVSSAKRELGKVIDARAQSAMDITLSGVFAHLAYAWWLIYEAELQKMIRDSKTLPSEALQGGTRTALTLCEEGLKLCKRAGLDEQIKTEAKAFFVYSLLINHWVYHKTEVVPVV